MTNIELFSEKLSRVRKIIKPMKVKGPKWIIKDTLGFVVAAFHIEEKEKAIAVSDMLQAEFPTEVFTIYKKTAEEWENTSTFFYLFPSRFVDSVYTEVTSWDYTNEKWMQEIKEEIDLRIQEQEVQRIARATEK